MKHKFILFYFCLIGLNTFAQSPNSKFEISNINLPYLEHLVKTKIDQFRQSKTLNPLYNDSILYVAAQDHARYLVNTKRNSHYQRETLEKEYAQNRAEYYGASKNYEVVENVSKTTILVPTVSKVERQQKRPKEHIAETYERAAQDILDNWLYDKHDVERILLPQLEVIGIAIEIDKRRSQLKTVVKMAHIKWQYQFKEYLHFFKYAKPLNQPYINSFKQIKKNNKLIENKWKLTPITNPKECEPCKTRRALHTAVWLEQDERDNIYILTDDMDWATTVFKNQTDGVALEIVRYASFDCGNPDYYTMPSRRNGLSALNGEVLEPVQTNVILGFYNKKKQQFEAKRTTKIQNLEKALKKNKHPSRAERIEKRLAEWKVKPFEPPPLRVKIGRLPKDIQGYYALNLLLIRDKQVCRIVHFTGYCGEPYQQISTIPYQHNLNKNRPSVEYKTQVKTQDLTFTIPFKKNEYDFTYDDVRPFIEALTSEKFTAREIYIEAFTSVEGDTAINRRLQLRRSNSIIDAILSQQVDKSVIKKIDAKANWNLFYKQIKNTEFNKWAKLPKDEIIDLFLDDRLEAKFEPYLSEQRKAIVRLKVEIIVKAPQSSSVNFSLRGFQDAVTNARLRNGQINLEQLQLAEMIQDELFQRVKKGKLSPTFIQKMTIPKESFFMNLLNNQIYIELQLNQLLGKKGEALFPLQRIYHKMYDYTKLDNPAPKLIFNHAAFLVNHWGEKWYGGRLQPTEIYEDIRFLAASPLSPKLVDKLWLNYHFNAIHHYQNIRGTESREQLIFSLEAIYYHHQDRTISATKALQLAKLFIWAETPTFAAAILESFAKKARPNPDVLSLYLKLSFRHIEEYPNSNYFNQLKKAQQVLSKTQWCDLFIGECRINFQIFDYEELRNLYCKTCGNMENYGHRF